MLILKKNNICIFKVIIAIIIKIWITVKVSCTASYVKLQY